MNSSRVSSGMGTGVPGSASARASRKAAACIRRGRVRNAVARIDPT
jgi:hypothetical protein